MFVKATKKQSRLRLALFGSSGAGKTYTALSLASGIGGKVAVIDTENNTACKYSDRFSFDVCSTDDASIDNMISIMTGAEIYSTLIIDSMSHSWYELIEEVNRLANSKYRGNTWSAWSEGTPKQKQFVRALLNFPGHIIVTMRVKTEWILEKTDKGTNRPVKAGLNPEAGKGIEYEFDMLMELDQNHIGYISKDRTGKFQDKTINKPGAQLGKDLIDWLNDGVESDYIVWDRLLKEQATIDDLKKKAIELADLIKVNKVTINVVERERLAALYKQLLDRKQDMKVVKS